MKNISVMNCTVTTSNKGSVHSILQRKMDNYCTSQHIWYEPRSMVVRSCSREPRLLKTRLMKLWNQVQKTFHYLRDSFQCHGSLCQFFEAYGPLPRIIILKEKYKILTSTSETNFIEIIYQIFLVVISLLLELQSQARLFECP